jgi:NAD(P)-dependent dehydrogenase (short-subunit alcohol dehydrogenase family)
VIRVHLKGTFNTTKFAAAHWRALRDGSAENRIINFTSVSGLHGAPGQPNYAAAKMGIVGLTYSAANSLAKYGVTVNAVSPAEACPTPIPGCTACSPSPRRSARSAARRLPRSRRPTSAWCSATAGRSPRPACWLSAVSPADAIRPLTGHDVSCARI